MKKSLNTTRVEKFGVELHETKEGQKLQQILLREELSDSAMDVDLALEGCGLVYFLKIEYVSGLRFGACSPNSP